MKKKTRDDTRDDARDDTHDIALFTRDGSYPWRSVTVVTGFSITV